MTVREVHRPYSTRECADFLGVSDEYIRCLIATGHLEAEYVVTPGKTRGVHRIHHERFVQYLKRIRWTRIPQAETR